MNSHKVRRLVADDAEDIQAPIVSVLATYVIFLLFIFWYSIAEIGYYDSSRRYHGTP